MQWERLAHHAVGGASTPCSVTWTLFSALSLGQVNAVCYGAKVMLPGVLRFDPGIEVSTEVVVMTTKGEAVALGRLPLHKALLVQCEQHVCAGPV